MSSLICPKCGEEGCFRPMGWKSRILIAVFTAVMVLISGLALTMIGAGLPLLVASPVVALLLPFLPWKRCHRCGHMTVR